MPAALDRPAYADRLHMLHRLIELDRGRVRGWER
jgi:hypothetical protein